jgi:hypothetical protein
MIDYFIMKTTVFLLISALLSFCVFDSVQAINFVSSERTRITQPNVTRTFKFATATPTTLVAPTYITRTSEQATSTVGIEKMGEQPTKHGSPDVIISPEMCASEPYIFDNFLVLGCISLMPDAPFQCQPNSTNLSTTTIADSKPTSTPEESNGIWHSCDTNVDLVYEAVDKTGTLVDCDDVTQLPGTEWKVRGCYATTLKDGQAASVLQCSSNGSLLQCTGERRVRVQQIETMTSGNDTITSDHIDHPTPTPDTDKDVGKDAAFQNADDEGITPSARIGIIITASLASAVLVGFAIVVIRRRVMRRRAERERRNRFTDFTMPA